MKTLGIDTSNYTTSASVCENGIIKENVRIGLEVSKGGVGLRQSDAVFAHIKNIPQLMKRLESDISDIDAVGVSSKPRDAEGSYMPCFLSGVSVATSVARALNVPIYEFSHQSGHIKAAMYSAGVNFDDTFYAYHLSGGTFELLEVTPCDGGYAVKIIGGSRDVTAGQLIDRIGVKLGLKFPCGAELEKLANTFEGKLPKPKISVKDTFCNMSGGENLCEKLINENAPPSMTAAYLTEFIRLTLEKMTDNLLLNAKSNNIIFSGGVSSNKTLSEFMKKKYGAHCAEPQFSQDNAAGIALLCMEKLNDR